MKKLLIISLLSLMLFSGCNMMKDTKTKVTEEVEELETEITDNLSDMEEEAIEDASKVDKINRDKIDEAVTYIHEHIDDPFESEDITKKIYYYSSYIVAVADKKGIDVDNDIYTFAQNTKDYVRSLYRKEAKDDDSVITTLRTGIDQIANRLDDTKDDLVDKFYDLIK